jgi:hypothetical protein
MLRYGISRIHFIADILKNETMNERNLIAILELPLSCCFYGWLFMACFLWSSFRMRFRKNESIMIRKRKLD